MKISLKKNGLINTYQVNTNMCYFEDVPAETTTAKKPDLCITRVSNWWIVETEDGQQIYEIEDRFDIGEDQFTSTYNAEKEKCIELLWDILGHLWVTNSKHHSKNISIELISDNEDN